MRPMMILSIIYMSAIIVIAVSAIAGAALYRIDKNAERQEKAE
jgi:hypothetical protein